MHFKTYLVSLQCLPKLVRYRQARHCYNYAAVITYLKEMLHSIENCIAMNCQTAFQFMYQLLSFSYPFELANC